MAHFKILKEARTSNPGGWVLCFQFGIYEYEPDDANTTPAESGYRFIWRRPNGQLQGARGQARLEPVWITMLLGKAAEEGWYPVPPPVNLPHGALYHIRNQAYFVPGQPEDLLERLQQALISDPRLQHYGRVATGFHGTPAAREYAWVQSVAPIPENLLKEMATASGVKVWRVEHVLT